MSRFSVKSYAIYHRARVVKENTTRMRRGFAIC